jgi:GST-like protein
MGHLVLYGRPGWGSAIVEAQLDWYGLSFEVVETGDLLDSEAARQDLRPLNGLAQVPVLRLPDGQVLTESAAITLYLADMTRSDSLVPGPDAPERAAFLRWLVFMVANIYPTFTYGDVPARFVPEASAQTGFRECVDAYLRRLWTLVEAEVKGPHFLGERFSALDIYLAVLTRWRPGPAWFNENAPLVATCAQKAASRPELAEMMAHNFPPEEGGADGLLGTGPSPT